MVVQCQGRRFGLGFALGSTRTIVAADDIGSCRRELSVATLDGQPTGARLVSNDRGASVLVLDGSLPVEPFEMRQAPLRRGETVHALGVARRSGDGSLAAIVTTGTVAYADGEVVQSDVPHPEGTLGAPLIDEEGRVVAILDDRGEGGLSRSLAIGPVGEALASAGTEDLRPAVYPGFGVSVGLLWDSGDRLFGGMALFALDLFDRLILRTEVGAYVSDAEAFASDTRRVMTVVQAAVGYRMRAVFGRGRSMSLIPSIGFSFSHDKSEVTTQRVSLVDPACDLGASACELSTTREETESSEWRYRPTLGLRIAAGNVELGYEALFDFGEIGDTGHRLHIGFRF